MWNLELYRLIFCRLKKKNLTYVPECVITSYQMCSITAIGILRIVKKCKYTAQWVERFKRVPIYQSVKCFCPMKTTPRLKYCYHLSIIPVGRRLVCESFFAIVSRNKLKYCTIHCNSFLKVLMCSSASFNAIIIRQYRPYNIITIYITIILCIIHYSFLMVTRW